MSHSVIPIKISSPSQVDNEDTLDIVNQVILSLNSKSKGSDGQTIPRVWTPGKDDNKLNGGNFLGTHLKVLLQEENLDKLSDLPVFEIIKEYLISLDKVHILSTSKKFPAQPAYHGIMEEWRKAHKKAVEAGAGIATLTPKCHIVGTH